MSAKPSYVEAVRSMQQAADLLPMARDAYFGTFYQVGLAHVQAQAGQADAALAGIHRLLTVPAGGVLSVARLKLDPMWDPLRKDPRFQQLIAGGGDVPPQAQ